MLVEVYPHKYYKSRVVQPEVSNSVLKKGNSNNRQSMFDMHVTNKTNEGCWELVVRERNIPQNEPDLEKEVMGE